MQHLVRTELTFQFHYGTIKRIELCIAVTICIHFNSTMVRLKVGLYVSSGSPPSFQFHYGTIKRFTILLCVVSVQYFNSTMVRLKAECPQGIKGYLPYFNSTMVRLKDTPVFRIRTYADIFQFHYGTIKRRNFV